MASARPSAATRFGVEPKEIRDLGSGTVLVNMRVTGQGSTSGVPIDLDYVQLWTIRGGLVTRVDKYDSVADALADGLVARVASQMPEELDLSRETPV